MRILTGIRKLDEVIEGGFPPGTNGLIVSDLGSPVSAFVGQILWNCLHDRRRCTFGSLRHGSAEEFAGEMDLFGFDFRPFLDERQLTFTDYVRESHVPEDAVFGSFRNQDLGRMGGAIIKISKFIETFERIDYDVGFLDNVNILFGALGLRGFINWGYGMRAAVSKRKDAVAFTITYHKGLPTTAKSIMLPLASSIIELKSHEDRSGRREHFFRVERMKDTRVRDHSWILYRLGERGISTP